MFYCVDKKKRRALETRSRSDTGHFIEHEAYKDIALVIPALNELDNTKWFDNPGNLQHANVARSHR